MPPTLLLTRPMALSRRFAAGLDLAGAGVVISPLIAIRPVVHDGTALAQARGLVFTSAHAVTACGPGAGRPAICVGPATAAAAAAAGFSVTQGPGDARGLLPMLRDLGPGWLHPHGVHVARPLPVPGIVVYDQVELPLNGAARDLLARPGLVVLPLFSPRSARLMAGQVGGAKADLWLVPISPTVAAAWGNTACAGQRIAHSPDGPGMRAAVQALLGGEQTR